EAPTRRVRMGARGVRRSAAPPGPGAPRRRPCGSAPAAPARRGPARPAEAGRGGGHPRGGGAPARGDEPGLLRLPRRDAAVAGRDRALLVALGALVAPPGLLRGGGLLRGRRRRG